jgi:hypothetical protein
MELIKKALSKSFQRSTKAGKICTVDAGPGARRIDLRRSPVQKLVDETLLVMARDPQKDGIALRVQVAAGPQRSRRSGAARAGAAESADQRPPGDARHGRLAHDQGQKSDGIRRVLIQVIDTGPGIPDKHLPKIFEPFFTTKGTRARARPRAPAWGWRSARRSSSTIKGRSIEVAATFRPPPRVHYNHGDGRFLCWRCGCRRLRPLSRPSRSPSFWRMMAKI